MNSRLHATTAALVVAAGAALPSVSTAQQQQDTGWTMPYQRGFWGHAGLSFGQSKLGDSCVGTLACDDKDQTFRLPHDFQPWRDTWRRHRRAPAPLTKRPETAEAEAIDVARLAVADGGVERMAFVGPLLSAIRPRGERPRSGWRRVRRGAVGGCASSSG